MGWWRSFRHKAQLARSLTRREWPALMEAWWRLGRTSLALRRVSYDRLLSSTRFNPKEKANPNNDLVFAQRLQQLISMAARCHIPPKTCLSRAITLHQMLARGGIQSRVCIGVGKITNNVQAHAWVEVEGKAIGEAEDITERFKVLNPVKKRNLQTH